MLSDTLVQENGGSRGKTPTQKEAVVLVIYLHGYFARDNRPAAWDGSGGTEEGGGVKWVVKAVLTNLFIFKIQ